MIPKDRIRMLDRQVKRCRKCRLWKGNAVPGEGPADADMMLIGQNPGQQEDEQGRPFVGQAGKYLDKMLEDRGIDKKRLYITSILKHKTPGNRKPRKDEIEACLPYLIEQMNIIGPGIVMLMGNVAKDNAPRYKDIRYIETCHPAAAMRFPSKDKEFKKDLSMPRKMQEKDKKKNQKR
ncbi:uracil-DNA glycosylase [Candidatus Woesearchaeota archaeon]|nr:uracil-DNA glycosylase [Candidatus Woesearchaeota archaeon]